MNIDEILSKVDRLFEENRSAEAEKLMLDSLSEAEATHDDGVALQLLNELEGYYRAIGDREKIHIFARKSLARVNAMGLKGTLPYATTLLNVANGYRAAGDLQESLELYREVEELYTQLLEPNSMFIASLENNISLLYQELGWYEEAERCLLIALTIVRTKGDPEEEAVTLTNLAETCVQLDKLAEAEQYSAKALQIFGDNNITDSHYGAALYVAGLILEFNGDRANALKYYQAAADNVEINLGHNDAYDRLISRMQECRELMLQESEAANGECMDSDMVSSDNNACGFETKEKVRSEQCNLGEHLKGLELSRAFYEEVVRPMLERDFPEYLKSMAIGLAGGGSDCYGYDDAESMDHDWGPEVCIWISDSIYDEIGEQLEAAYGELPREFRGYKRATYTQGSARRGVMTVRAFIDRRLGEGMYDILSEGLYTDSEWNREQIEALRTVPDHALSSVVNGELFLDNDGEINSLRIKLSQAYPEELRFVKIAQEMAGFSQTGQYNMLRMLVRGDRVVASVMLGDALRHAMKLQHAIEGRFAPHDKWLFRSLCDTETGTALAELLAVIDIDDNVEAGNNIGHLDSKSGSVDLINRGLEKVAEFLVRELFAQGVISDIDNYLDAHTEEVLKKAQYLPLTIDELAMRIAELEFKAFDKVKNEGGRADCQDNWGTFSIMRRSQYLTWDKYMLMQYLYDFTRELSRGHNLIEEKYGRMEESTAPEKYAEMKDSWPEITAEKKNIIEAIVGIQVKWMEEFAAEYPLMAGNARSIHTYEDNPFNTSYETYLRGEISTYSDKMLQLYGGFIAGIAGVNGNLAYMTMENTAKLYGYEGVEAAETALRQTE